MCCHRNKTCTGIHSGLGSHSDRTCHTLVATDNQHMAMVHFVRVPVSDRQFSDLVFITQHPHTGFDCIKDTTRYRKISEIKLPHHLRAFIGEQPELPPNESDCHVGLNTRAQNVARIGAQPRRNVYRKHGTVVQVNR